MFIHVILIYFKRILESFLIWSVYLVSLNKHFLKLDSLITICQENLQIKGWSLKNCR